MKTTITGVIAILAISASLASCGKKETVKTSDADSVATASQLSANYTVDTTASTLGWTGKKVTGQHNGMIKISEGTISVENNVIKAGSFVINMNSISNLDLASDVKSSEKLVGHLKSADFFDAGKFPTSKFEITAAEKLAAPDSAGNNYNIKGNLTMKDITKNITIPANVTLDSTQFTATSKFAIDRTEWNIQYGSGKFMDNLGDKAINDAIELDLNLKATPKK